MTSSEKNAVVVELYDLPISQRKDDRFGRVVTSKSLNEDDLIELAVANRTEFNRSTLRAALDILKDIAAEQIVNGAAVSFGLVHFNVVVNGIFTGDNANWNKEKNRLSFRIIPANILRNKLKLTEVQVRGMAATGTVVNTVYDLLSAEENNRLTAGGGVNLSGTRLKIAGDNPAVGISLIHTETKEVARIPFTSIMVNTPSKLSFIVPATLAPGDYKLCICTQFSRSGVLLKQPQTYCSDYLLLVQP